MWLLESEKNSLADYSSFNFKNLWNKEKDIQNIDGTTAIMNLCR